MFNKGPRRRVLDKWHSRHGAPEPEAEERPRVRRRRRAPTPSLPRPDLKSIVMSPGRILLFLGALIGTGLVAHLATSPRYLVAAPVVLGNERLDVAEVGAAAGVTGKPAYRLVAADLEAQVERHPEIARAQVSIRLPNRVTVQVEETRRVLKWETPGGRLAVDVNGLMVSGADGHDIEGVPTVSDPQGLFAQRGRQLPPGTVDAALAHAPHFASLTYHAEQGLVGTTLAGWQVRLGLDPQRATHQVATLQALQARLPAADVAVVDLRFDRPFYRLRSEGASP